MRLGFDLDGVLADFTTKYAELLVQMTGRDLLPPDWREQLATNAWPTVWFWERELGYTKDEEGKAWKDHILKEEHDFWCRLAPLESNDTFDRIERLQCEGHDVYFVTTRPGQRAKEQSEVWLMGWGIYNPTVLIALGSKVPIIQALNLDFYIDDKPETMVELCQAMGYDKHFYLKDAPYNQHVMGSIKAVSNVDEALDKAGL